MKILKLLSDYLAPPPPPYPGASGKFTVSEHSFVDPIQSQLYARRWIFKHMGQEESLIPFMVLNQTRFKDVSLHVFFNCNEGEKVEKYFKAFRIYLSLVKVNERNEKSIYFTTVQKIDKVSRVFSLLQGHNSFTLQACCVFDKALDTTSYQSLQSSQAVSPYLAPSSAYPGLSGKFTISNYSDRDPIESQLYTRSWLLTNLTHNESLIHCMVLNQTRAKDICLKVFFNCGHVEKVEKYFKAKYLHLSLIKADELEATNLYMTTIHKVENVRYFFLLVEDYNTLTLSAHQTLDDILNVKAKL